MGTKSTKLRRFASVLVCVVGWVCFAKVLALPGALTLPKLAYAAIARALPQVVVPSALGRDDELKFRRESRAELWASSGPASCGEFL
jgi:hypothetical protein